MFEYLKNFKKIIVVGPQRSGTTICAEMIAFDLGMRFVNETEFVNFNKNKLKKSVDLALQQTGVVLQAPSASSFCHNLPQDVAVVFVMRPIEEILKSQERIEWDGNKLELELLDAESGDSCVLKQKMWSLQKKIIKHSFEIPYHSLNKHPLWIEPELRTKFSKKQTKLQVSFL